MDISIHKAGKSDSFFVFQCLQILLDKEFYKAESFDFYFSQLLESPDAPEFWIATINDEKVGLITANKIHLPRFLGYGYEFEEIVILPQFQKRGFGKAFILKLINHYNQNPLCRKIVIKSNDHKGSCKLYETMLDSTDFEVFQLYLNKI